LFDDDEKLNTTRAEGLLENAVYQTFNKYCIS